MVGWLVTDGYIKKTQQRRATGEIKEYRYGKITQSKPPTVEALKALGLAYHVDNHNSDHGKFVANYKKHVFTIPKETFDRIEKSGIVEKALSWEFLKDLSRRQLELLRETMMLGDGTGQNRFCGDERPIFFMTMIQTLLGLPTTFYKQEEHCWRTRVIKSKSICTSTWKRNPTREHYDGTIWCPSVDTGFWLAEREGLVFITGNTESNIEVMAKSLIGLKRKGLKLGFDPKSKRERAMYQKFWARTMTRGLTVSITLNTLMAVLSGLTGDEEDDITLIEQYKRAWDADWKRVLDVDVTPIYRAMKKFTGQKTEGERKYFSIIGHFVDPIKFALSPVKSAHHKGSILYSTVYEAMSGGDWRGQEFTTIPELLGMDEKGVYKKTGLPKGGKLTGSLTSRKKSTGSIGYEQIPSYAAHRARSVLPIQIQEALKFIQGDADGWDTVLRGLGAHASSGYKSDYVYVSEELDEVEEEALKLKTEGQASRDMKKYHEYRREHAQELRMVAVRKSTVKQINMLGKSLRRTTDEKQRERLETRILESRKTFLKKYKETVK